MCLSLLFLALHTLILSEPVASTDSLYVVRHAWHPAVLLPLPHAEPLLLGPLEGASADYVEVGWGDAGYYPDPSPGFWSLLRAALWPTPSVVQIIPVSRAIERFAPRGRIVAVPLPPGQVDEVIKFIRSEMRFRDGVPVDMAPSLYGNGRFFAAEKHYHVFRNSNHWAAALLEQAGCDLSVWQSFTVELLFQQVEDCGEILREE